MVADPPKLRLCLPLLPHHRRGEHRLPRPARKRPEVATCALAVPGTSQRQAGLLFARARAAALLPRTPARSADGFVDAPGFFLTTTLPLAPPPPPRRAAPTNRVERSVEQSASLFGVMQQVPASQRRRAYFWSQHARSPRVLPRTRGRVRPQRLVLLTRRGPFCS